MPEQFSFAADDEDAAAIHAAIARRQTWRIMPDGDGDLTGRVLAEICRGWLERLDMDRDDETR